jgi:CubicO group peptidase (beta-lactamase class C family)
MKNRHSAILVRSLVGLALFAIAGASSAESPSAADRGRLERFEKQVEDLREQLKIPGVSAVIVKDQEVLWARGFGFADLEKRVPATPDTLYSIASLTKPFAATLVMQLVEQGKLDLDEPIARYSAGFTDDSVRIKHLISHTSHGTPGDGYQYDGSRFAELTPVIEKKFGKPIVNVMVDSFLEPLQMSSSVPQQGIVVEAEKWVGSLGQERIDRYAKNLSKLSRPYTLYGDQEILETPYPTPSELDAAAGLLSTVMDMAKFDAAIDRHVFISKETQEKAWTPFVSNAGQRLPYGLGWFVSDYQGERLIWHYGHWGNGFSSLHIKLPAHNLTLIMLANSEALSDHQYQVGEDITNNVFACRFIRVFAFEDAARDAGNCERDSQTALAKWRDHRRSTARTAIRLAPAVLDAYVGQYQYVEPPNRIFTVRREGDRLFVDIPKDHKTEIFAEAESRFFMKLWPRWLVFIGEGGRVTHMDLVVDDNEKYRAKKIR